MINKFYSVKWNYLELHFIILILGFTAILGKLIHIPAAELVWYRTLIAFTTLFIYLKLKKTDYKIPVKQLFKISGIGLIIAAHWICFFHAIKVSNVSVTLGCLATTTLFTSFLEPLSQRRKILWIEVLIGVIIIIGLYIIFQFETRYVTGIIYALLAAFLAGVFSVINKNITTHYNADVISFYEMLGGFTGINIYFLITMNTHEINLALTFSDFIYLVILAVICTAYAFAAVVKIMKELSAYVIVLSINLEPIYGIILAFLFFGETERMTSGFYLGTAIVLAAVFLYPVLIRLSGNKKQRKS